MRLLITTALCLVLAQAQAEGLSVSPKDSLPSVVAAQKGKRVTLRLRSGQELTGVLREASDRLAVLGELTGREFFDAAVPMEAIEAVIVRTKP